MAADINKIVLLGRLTRDAELTVTGSGFSITRISLAVNRNRKQGDQWVDEANFFDATIYGKRGEALQNYLRKGQQVVIEGKLKQERWEQDGAKRSRVSIDIDELSLVGGRTNDSAQPNNYNNSNAAKPSFTPQQPSAPKPVPPPPFSDDVSFDDSDIPF